MGDALLKRTYTYIPALAFSGLAAVAVVHVLGMAAGHARWVAPVTAALLLALGAAYAYGTLDQSRASIDEGTRQERLRSQLETLDIAPGTAIFLLDFPRIGNFGLFERSDTLAQSIFGPSVSLYALSAGRAEQQARDLEGPVLYVPTEDGNIVEASRWGLDPWQASVGAPDEEAGELPDGYRIERVLGGLNRPTQIVAASGGRLFIAEQGGAVRVVLDDVLLPEPLVTIDVSRAEDAGADGLIEILTRSETKGIASLGAGAR